MFDSLPRRNGFNRSQPCRTKILTIFKDSDKNDNAEPTTKEEFFTVPYISTISESFIPLAKKFGFNTAFSIPYTLNSFVKYGKDSLDPMSHHGVVYKISCHDCEASYVGQIKRQLRTRINEYISDIRKKNGSPSVISEHRINHNHDHQQ